MVAQSDQNNQYDVFGKIKKRYNDVFGKVTSRKKKSNDEHLETDASSQRILLYRDESLIRDIHHKVIAEAIRDDNIFQKAKRIILGNSLFSGDSSFDGLIGVDEVTLKPTAKWALGVEIGTDVELKWKLGHENIDNIILNLFSVLPKISVSDVIQKSKDQKAHTPLDDLVYPGMPLTVCGCINAKEDISSKEVIIHKDSNLAYAFFANDHNLQQGIGFLKKRELHVLGIIKNIGRKLSIQAGAVLLLDQDVQT